MKLEQASSARTALTKCNHPDWRIVITVGRTGYVSCKIGKDTVLSFPSGSAEMWIEYAWITQENIASFIQACKRYNQAKSQFNVDLINHWVEKNK